MKRRLQALIASRLALALTLLGTVAISNLVTSQRVVSSLLVVAALVSLLTILYLILLRLNSAYGKQAQAQLLVDILVVTALVYLTGDVVSPLSALYLIVILVASSLLERRTVFFLAATSALLYGTICALVLDRLIPPSTLLLQHSQPSVTTTIATVQLCMIGFFVMAALSNHLADRLRRSAVELESTNRRLAGLTAYNDRVIESISSGLVTVELDGTVVTFNPSAQQITGYTQQEVRGRQLRKFLPNIAESVRSSSTARDGARKFARLLADERHADGTPLHIGFSIAPLVNDDSALAGFVIALQDLTEITRMEERMRRSERLAVIGRMAAAIAHEIRNPLASMRGAVQALQSELELSEDQATLMDIVLRESDRLNRTITDFLAYSRPPAAQPALVNLKEILSETITLITCGGEMHQQHRVIESYPEDDVLYVADANQVRQVCWNLARNALSAMPDGGELRVSLDETADGGVSLHFEDSGVGMTEAQMEHLFEPFTSTRTNGTGLGLAIVNQIIEDHEGKILVTSKSGCGTRIEIHLPPVSYTRPPDHAPDSGGRSAELR